MSNFIHSISTLTWKSKLKSLIWCIWVTISVISLKFTGYVALILIYKAWKFGSNPYYHGWNTAFFQRDCFLLVHPVYISRLCYDASVYLSVRLSVTEVHWRIIANLGFKLRSHFTVHCGRHAAGGHRAACGRIISRHASQLLDSLVQYGGHPPSWIFLTWFFEQPIVSGRPMCISVQNLIEIWQIVDEMLHFISFLKMMAMDLWGEFWDDPHWVFDGLYLCAKFGKNYISCFDNTKVWILCAFGLKMPILAYFWAVLGLKIGGNGNFLHCYASRNAITWNLHCMKQAV